MSPVTADRWNLLIPAGYPVRYWPGPIGGHSRDSTTRSPAWTLPSGSPVVKVEGYAGGIHLDHVMPLVLVSRLYVECAYPIRPVDHGPVCMSDCCRGSASSAVQEPSGVWTWRCQEHRYLTRDGKQGPSSFRVTRKFTDLPTDVTSARRMLETEDHFKRLAANQATITERVLAGETVDVLDGIDGHSPPRFAVVDESSKITDSPAAQRLLSQLSGQSRRTIVRDDDTPEVRMILTAAADLGWDHRDYPGLLRAAEILRHQHEED